MFFQLFFISKHIRTQRTCLKKAPEQNISELNCEEYMQYCGTVLSKCFYFIHILAKGLESFVGQIVSEVDFN